MYSLMNSDIHPDPQPRDQPKFDRKSSRPQIGIFVSDLSFSNELKESFYTNIGQNATFTIIFIIL